MLVDTHVLVDVLENDAEWADGSIAQLQAQSRVHRLAINPIIHSELSLAFSTVEALDAVMAGMALEMRDIPRPALFLAGKAFVQYRRQGGAKAHVLGDFFIAAHAAVEKLPMLTRDPRRYQRYSPTVQLVTHWLLDLFQRSPCPPRP